MKNFPDTKKFLTERIYKSYGGIFCVRLWSFDFRFLIKTNSFKGVQSLKNFAEFTLRLPPPTRQLCEK